MRTDNFDYFLPSRLIAQEGAEPRDAARLLVIDRQSGRRSHRRFRDLPEYLRPGDCLVLNNTKVIPARLIGRKASGGRVEVLLLRPVERDGWEALVRPSRRVPPGTALTWGEGELTAVVGENRGDGLRLVRMSAPGGLEAALGRHGTLPLPPYIRADLPDPSRYQTVYATRQGSVAAPTAGLHFTPALLDRLEAAGVKRVEVTLHVGLGTFRPVETDELEEHRMHSEAYVLSHETAETINSCRAAGGRVVAVGTTATRTLETCVSEGGRIEPGAGWTDLFIRPGCRFRAVDIMITNFHLPRSTLLALVAAFAGLETVLEAYREAVEMEYRFYSLGDACLIV